MTKKYKLNIHYKVRENDSDWMSSDDKEDERHTIEVSTKEEIINFLKSLEYVRLNKEIMQELEERDFLFSDDMYELFTDTESSGWVSTDSSLSIKGQNAN